MAKNVSELIKKVFIDYCQNKGYQWKPEEDKDYIRLNVARLTEKSIVNIYNTGTIQIQGKRNSLRKELEDLKQEIHTNPEIYLGNRLEQKSSANTTYNIITQEFQDLIKESLNTIADTLLIESQPNDFTLYRSSIKKGNSKVVLTQFTNGTLLIQGKMELLFEEVCEKIERIANPSETEVIRKYISNNEPALKKFSEKDTPLLQENAKNEVEQKIGDAFNYLDDYNRKQFIAAQCLCNYDLDLPEYSAVVMPASKGFEGIIKNLLVDIQLVASNHFNAVGANFGPLCDKNNQNRINLCNMDKNMDTIFKKMDVVIKTNRHFIMHSDPSALTIINTIKEAIEKVNEIYKDTKYIFDYFNPLFNLI